VRREVIDEPPHRLWDPIRGAANDRNQEALLWGIRSFGTAPLSSSFCHGLFASIQDVELVNRPYEKGWPAGADRPDEPDGGARLSVIINR
jgi:hypothetical protein